MPNCENCGKYRADLTEGKCSDCRKPSAGTMIAGVSGIVALLGCLAVVAVVIIMVLAFAGGLVRLAFTGTDHSNQPSEVATAKIEVGLTVDELRDKFTDNQIAGAQFFEQHTALVSGQVIGVREAVGTGIVKLRSPRGDDPLEIGFNDAATKDLGLLRKGDKIVAHCPNVQEAMAQVIVVCDRVEMVK